MGGALGLRALVLSSPNPFDPAPVAKILAAVDQEPFIDVVQRARHGWGILRENLLYETAERLAERFREDRVPVALVPMEQIVTPREPNEIRKFQLEPDGFSFAVPRTASGKRKLVPWSYLELVAVGAVRSSSSRITKEKTGPSAGAKIAATGITLMTGIPIPLGKSKVVEKKTETVDFEFLLDLFVRRTHFRMRADLASLDFSFLGKRLSPSRFENFRVLVEELLARAPAALRNRGAQGVLNGKPAASLGYENEGELNRECRWLLTVASVAAR